MLWTGLIGDLVLSEGVPALVLAAAAGYFVLNLLSFIQFYADKRRAVLRRWRTPEGTLLLLAALGPFGAYAGMKAFHHKSRHLKFMLVPFFAIIHLFLFVLVLL